MRTFKLTSLSAAVLAASALVPATSQANGFIDDSSATLSIRNYYFNGNGINGDSYDRKEWVQGFQFEYESGYLWDIIGFDYAAGAAFKLDHPGHSPTNLPRSSDGDVNDIAGTNKANLKAKFGDDDMNVNLRFGLQRTCTELYCPSGSRILPATAYGTYLEGNLSSLKVYGAQWTKTHRRENSYFAKDLEDDFGNEIDDITLIGAAYKFDMGLGIYAEWGNSDDYLEKHFFKVDYTFDLGSGITLLVDGRWAKQEEDGDGYSNQGHESQYWNLTGTLTVNDFYVKLGYNKTSDGDWQAKWHNDHDQDGVYNSTLDQWQGYNREDEKGWLVGIGYDFANIGYPGLNASTYYAYGSGMKDTSLSGSDHNAHEWGQYVSYKVQSGPMKDLSVSWEHYHTANPASTDDDTNRIKIKYDIALF
ncbi:OprD family outer membrane porin [Zooshikella ganghwensis]|uniref:OprD family outer membrane porin n=1 Tax=Zooshikella ganghwensis TaxID=202772 RepID=UPI000421D786|nr:OprD family outer membrane porin [Zooshikella ganghwensis]